MRMYSDNALEEFHELCNRAKSGGLIRLILKVSHLSEKTYTIEGFMNGVELGSICLKNAKLISDDKDLESSLKYMVHEGNAMVPLGDYLINYEILTDPHFNGKQEREDYYKKLALKIKTQSWAKTYTEAIYGPF